MSNLKFTVIFKIFRFLLKLGDRHYAFWPFINYSRGKIDLIYKQRLVIRAGALEMSLLSLLFLSGMWAAGLMNGRG